MSLLSVRRTRGTNQHCQLGEVRGRWWLARREWIASFIPKLYRNPLFPPPPLKRMETPCVLLIRSAAQPIPFQRVHFRQRDMEDREEITDLDNFPFLDLVSIYP